jgi:hypothetical protein
VIAGRITGQTSDMLMLRKAVHMVTTVIESRQGPEADVQFRGTRSPVEGYQHFVSHFNRRQRD